MASQFALGAARVTVLNCGDLKANAREWMGLAEGALPQIPGDIHVPLYCIHIALGRASVLVDAPLWDFGPQSDDADLGITGYAPPPPIPDQLRTAGIDTAGIGEIVITHAHTDHYNGLVTLTDDFPNARVLLGRGDWDAPAMQQGLTQPGSLQLRTFGRAHHLGRLTLVEGKQTLVSGPDGDITVLPAPGETPGHQVLRLQSRGEVLYCLGDLYHHPLEAELRLDVHWSDPAQSRPSRDAIEPVALRERALLIATHIHAPGRFEAIAGGVRWGQA